VALRDNDPYLFNCETCRHEFDMAPSTVVSGSWCPYCANKRRCEEEKCTHCHARSIASYPKAARYWSVKNPFTIRSIALYSKVICIFDCDACGNEFTAQAFNVALGGWCPHCRNKTEIKLLEWLKTTLPTLTITPTSTLRLVSQSSH
jgi:hypothetical protein